MLAFASSGAVTSIDEPEPLAVALITTVDPETEDTVAPNGMLAPDNKRPTNSESVFPDVTVKLALPLTVVTVKVFEASDVAIVGCVAPVFEKASSTSLVMD